MRPHSYQTSSHKNRNIVFGKQKMERAKSNRYKSQKMTDESPFSIKQTRNVRSESKVQDRKQKSITEQKIENSQKKLIKIGFSSKRYRIATSSSTIKKKENGQLVCFSSRPCNKQDTMLQDQRKSLAKLKQIKQDIERQQLTVPIKYRLHKSKEKNDSNSLRQKIYKLKSKSLKSYIEFICGKQGELNVGFDFTYIKSLTRFEATMAIDFSAFNILESIQLCTLDILEEAKQKKGGKLAREYSLLYFRHFEKNMMEVVLSCHYFKLAHSSLCLLFMLTRFFFIIIHELAESEELYDQAEILKQILKQILQIQKIVYGNKSQIEAQNNYVAQTLKILKITSQIEKRTLSLALKIKSLTNTLQKFQRLMLILKQFHPLEKRYDLNGLQLEFLAQAQVVIAWTYFGVPPIPYLPPPTKTFTIILSIENMLIYFREDKKIVLYRPYLDHFLLKMSEKFELVAFSTQPKVKADQFINLIEKSYNYFTFRLYKEHLNIKDGKLVKDLSKLGRETEQVLIIDTVEGDPGVWRIPEFKGSNQDKVLLMLTQKEIMSFFNGDIKNGRKIGCFESLEHIQEQFEEERTISSNQ